MAKVEYLIIEQSPTQEKLNQLGREGWDWPIVMETPIAGVYRIIFKRPITEETFMAGVKQ